MPRITVPGFVEASNTERSIQAQVGRTINLWIESTGPQGGDAKAPSYLQGTPGIQPFTLFPDQPIRGLFEINGRLYVVGGALFAEVFSDGSIGPTHAVTNDGQPASMASNGTAGNQVMIVSGGNGYIYNTATLTFSQITDPDFPNPCKMCDFIGGYFVALKGGGSRSFSWSALEDGLTWDPLDVAEVSEAADNLGALIRTHFTLLLLGGETSETWQLTGDPTTVFAPYQGVLIEHGIIAPFTIQRIDNTVIWMGSNTDGKCIIWRMDGYTPRRISTFGVEQQLNQQSAPTDARALVYQLNGHVIYELVLPRNDRSWSYDVTMDRWTEHNLWDVNAAVWLPHVISTHEFTFDKHLVGDRFSGAIYEMSMAFTTDEVVPAI